MSRKRRRQGRNRGGGRVTPKGTRPRNWSGGGPPIDAADPADVALGDPALLVSEIRRSLSIYRDSFG